MAREEGRAARVYTISLLLLLLTWTPFYTAHCVQVLSKVYRMILSSQRAFVVLPREVANYFWPEIDFYVK